jgi:hypothetical protein
MFETAPYHRALATSLADADSLRYYPAYEATSLGALGDQSALAAEHHLQLLLVQRPDGSLTVGDTHAYDEPFDFALREEATEELLERARRILGTGLPPIGGAGLGSTPNVATAGFVSARRSHPVSGW